MSVRFCLTRAAMSTSERAGRHAVAFPFAGVKYNRTRVIRIAPAPSAHLHRPRSPRPHVEEADHGLDRRVAHRLRAAMPPLRAASLRCSGVLAAFALRATSLRCSGVLAAIALRDAEGEHCHLRPARSVTLDWRKAAAGGLSPHPHGQTHSWRSITSLRRYHPSSRSANATIHGMPTRSFGLYPGAGG